MLDELEKIGKILGAILLIVGFFLTVFGFFSLLGSEPNVPMFIVGVFALIIGGIITKTSS